MQISFYKYQGTGNDFILLDGMENHFLEELLTQDLIASWCHRRFGVGADGRRSTMCGNGGRCIVKFANDLGYIDDSCSFEAVDGIHMATIEKGNNVSLSMSDIKVIDQVGARSYVTNTGSPHFVEFCNHAELDDIVAFGKEIRFSDLYRKEGINVNRVYQNNDVLNVATYERGVEDETYSCGTGVTAAAACYVFHHIHRSHGDGINVDDHRFQLIKVETKGGSLNVSLKSKENGFTNVFLIGPATFVFKGELEF